VVIPKAVMPKAIAPKSGLGGVFGVPVGFCLIGDGVGCAILSGVANGLLALGVGTVPVLF
jgi:hypothetical protein